MSAHTPSDIVSALKSHGRVIIKGFGTFNVVAVPAREYRNPKTGAVVSKPAHDVVRFKASKAILGV